MREYFIDIPTIIIGIIIYIIIFILTILEYLIKKELILIFFLAEIIGLIYDGTIILLGFSMSDNVLLFFNKLRFILHGFLVPLLILFSGYALNLEGRKKLYNSIVSLLLSIIGIIVGIVTKLEIVNSILKRCTFSRDESKFVKIIFSLMNIGCVIYMIVAGIILYVKRRDYLFFLSGFCMFIFSAIGPATGNSDLNYLLSMYGEVLMIIFLYLFFKKNELFNSNNYEVQNKIK